MPRPKKYNPLNPAQAKTVHMLGWSGLWGKKVTPAIEVTVAVDGVRFLLNDQGKAKLIDGDRDKAKQAIDLLAHEGLTA